MRLPGKTERGFWAELSAHISGICAELGQINSSMVLHPPFSIHISGIHVEFGRKNSCMVPHPPLYKPILLSFRPHGYGFHPILRWSRLAWLKIYEWSYVINPQGSVWVVTKGGGGGGCSASC